MSETDLKRAVTKALDEAESKVFEIAEDRVVDSVRGINDLVGPALERIQAAYERGSTITGKVATTHRPINPNNNGTARFTL